MVRTSSITNQCGKKRWSMSCTTVSSSGLSQIVRKCWLPTFIRGDYDLTIHFVNRNSLRAGCLQDCSSMDVDGVGPSSALQKFPFAKLRSRLWEARGCLTEQRDQNILQ